MVMRVGEYNTAGGRWARLPALGVSAVGDDTGEDDGDENGRDHDDDQGWGAHFDDRRLASRYSAIRPAPITMKNMAETMRMTRVGVLIVDYLQVVECYRR